MTNLQSAVRALRWNQQRKESDFAKEFGITTKQYVRFETDKTVDVDVMLAVIRWLIADEDPPAVQQRSIELREPEA